MAGPNHGDKLLKRVTAFRQPGCVRRQVPAVDGQRGDPVDTFARKWAECHSAAQVASRIHHLRLPKVRVMASSPFAAKVGAVVAAIAIGLRVDDIAAYPDSIRSC